MMAQRVLPTELYHYTSPSGLAGIIQTGSVWATMIHYMNDSREFNYAISLARELITEADPDATAPRPRIAGEFLDTIRSVAVFVFSLTEHKDLLSQWRAYSSDGCGYSVGFSEDVLRTIASEENAIIAPCIYDRESQLAILRPIVTSMLEEADALPADGRGFDLLESFADRFTVAAAVVKHPSFVEEAEWRIVFGPGVDTKATDHRTSGTLLVPYYRCSIQRGGKYPISTIVVGPGTDRDWARRSLHYITSSRFRWPVKVEFSDSSYRPRGRAV